MPDITPAEAEKQAAKAIGDYISACHLETADRALLGNVLMKLVSIAGIAMASAEGRNVAAHRLRGVTSFVMKNGPAQPRPIVQLDKAIKETQQ